jgi:hypothetical protein
MQTVIKRVAYTMAARKSADVLELASAVNDISTNNDGDSILHLISMAQAVIDSIRSFARTIPWYDLINKVKYIRFGRVRDPQLIQFVLDNLSTSELSRAYMNVLLIEKKSQLEVMNQAGQV